MKNTDRHLRRQMPAIERAAEPFRRTNPSMRGLCVVVVDGDCAEDYTDAPTAILARASREHHDDPCVMVLPYERTRHRVACPDCARRFVEMAGRGVPVLVAADGLHYAASLERPAAGGA